LSGSEAENIITPRDLDNGLNVELPPLKSLQQVLERMRSIGADKVTLEVIRDQSKSNVTEPVCDLRILSETDAVTADTRFEQCKEYHWLGGPTESTTASLDEIGSVFKIRALLAVLQLEWCFHQVAGPSVSRCRGFANSRGLFFANILVKCFPL